MNTTVWLISFTTSNGERVQKVHTHNCVADYRLLAGGATVQEIDCAAVAELIEALTGLVSIEDSVTQGQERDRREEWLPKARAILASVGGAQ